MQIFRSLFTWMLFSFILSVSSKIIGGETDSHTLACAWHDLAVYSSPEEFKNELNKEVSPENYHKRVKIATTQLRNKLRGGDWGRRDEQYKENKRVEYNEGYDKDIQTDFEKIYALQELVQKMNPDAIAGYKKLKDDFCGHYGRGDYKAHFYNPYGLWEKDFFVRSWEKVFENKKQRKDFKYAIENNIIDPLRMTNTSFRKRQKDGTYTKWTTEKTLFEVVLENIKNKKSLSELDLCVLNRVIKDCEAGIFNKEKITPFFMDEAVVIHLIESYSDLAEAWQETLSNIVKQGLIACTISFEKLEEKKSSIDRDFYQLLIDKGVILSGAQIKEKKKETLQSLKESSWLSESVIIGKFENFGLYEFYEEEQNFFDEIFDKYVNQGHAFQGLFESCTSRKTYQLLVEAIERKVKTKETISIIDKTIRLTFGTLKQLNAVHKYLSDCKNTDELLSQCTTIYGGAMLETDEHFDPTNKLCYSTIFNNKEFCDRLLYAIDNKLVNPVCLYRSENEKSYYFYEYLFDFSSSPDSKLSLSEEFFRYLYRNESELCFVGNATMQNIIKSYRVVPEEIQGFIRTIIDQGQLLSTTMVVDELEHKRIKNHDNKLYKLLVDKNLIEVPEEPKEELVSVDDEFSDDKYDVSNQNTPEPISIIDEQIIKEDHKELIEIKEESVAIDDEIFEDKNNFSNQNTSEPIVVPIINDRQTSVPKNSIDEGNFFKRNWKTIMGSGAILTTFVVLYCKNLSYFKQNIKIQN